MSFLKKLRDAAAQCSNIEYRVLLRDSADRVAYLIADLQRDPTEENMQALNSAWAFAERVYNNMPPEGTPAPIAGAPEPARLAA
jgi:hypothetical protein